MANITIPLLSAIIGGLSGGLVFSFIQSWAWRWYTKPKLTIDASAATAFETNDEGEISARVFRVPIQNHGRSSAENCKPELRMTGNLDGNEYVINTQLHWYEDENPSRITINSGERAKYNLLRVMTEETDDYITVDPTFIVQFAGPDGWGGEDSIVKWEYDDDTGRATNVSVGSDLERDTFQEISWEYAEIIVTAGNTDKIESSIELDLGEERGMVGMEVMFNEGEYSSEQ
ncbi:hypothetical protein [Halorhabdus rudnickae]|uniref:hypothetical protein n=1 Tax=Halorhabdus rudnickae TaxID=1775544 RepID=UPI0010836AA2|nr:hypothetical protein [Halorhabdus rudnickae]